MARRILTARHGHHEIAAEIGLGGARLLADGRVLATRWFPAGTLQGTFQGTDGTTHVVQAGIYRDDVVRCTLSVDGAEIAHDARPRRAAVGGSLLVALGFLMIAWNLWRGTDWSDAVFGVLAMTVGARMVWSARRYLATKRAADVTPGTPS